MVETEDPGAVDVEEVEGGGPSPLMEFLQAQQDRGVAIMCALIEKGALPAEELAKEDFWRRMGDCVACFLNALLEGTAASLEDAEEA